MYNIYRISSKIIGCSDCVAINKIDLLCNLLFECIIIKRSKQIPKRYFTLFIFILFLLTTDCMYYLNVHLA